MAERWTALGSKDWEDRVASLARSQRNLPRRSGGEGMRKTGCRTSRKSRKRLPGQGCVGREASGARQQSPWGAELLYWPEAGAICRDGLAAKGCGRPAAVLPGKAGTGCLGRDALAEKRVGPVSRALGERSCFTGPKPARSAVTVWRRKDAEDRLPYFPEKPEKACLGKNALVEKKMAPCRRGLGRGTASLTLGQHNFPR